MPGDVVRVNNTLYSWTSTLFKVQNIPFEGIVAVDFDQKRERKIVYAANQAGLPLGWTSGKYSVQGFTIKCLRDTADNITTMLSLLGAGSYGDAEWNFIMQLVEPVIGMIPQTTVGAPCVIVGESDAQEEGIDELLTEFEIACLAMSKNGKQLYSAARQIAQAVGGAL